MDDTKHTDTPVETIKVTLADVEYEFAKLTESQIAAIILSQSLGEMELLRTAGLVLGAGAVDDAWRKILRRMATKEISVSQFTQMLSDIIQAPTGGQ